MKIEWQGPVVDPLKRQGRQSSKDGTRQCPAKLVPEVLRYNGLQYSRPPRRGPMRTPPPLSFPSMRTLMVQISLTALAMLCSPARADVHDDVERMIRNGQLERALQASQEHLKKSPQDPQMQLLSSRILEAQGKPDEAISLLESMVLEFPELPEPHNNLAVLYARAGRLQEALESLSKALLARPDYAVALENLGDLHLSLALHAYLRAGRAPDAPASALRKAETLTPLLRR